LFQEIGINEFCEIASEEDVVDERELIKAFRSIDKNQNGFIEYREFMDIFGNVIINI
jgi:Ca2+-binding EF-hand superfamily protein